MWWLLELTVMLMLNNARMNFTSSFRDFEPLAAISSSAAGVDNRLLTVAGDTAEIRIKGIMTKEPDFFARYFGGGNCTYGEIREALIAARDDANVKNTILRMDTPGGTVAGLYDTIDIIQNFGKPIETYSEDLLASAGYALACATNKITVNNRAARIGSIGTAMIFSVNENRIAVSNTDSPKKIPDVTTEEGKKAVQEELDAMQKLFVSVVAQGRNVDETTVTEKFGRGAVLIAEDALKVGMIDAINKYGDGEKPKTKNKPSTEGKKMNLTELKTQHPETYAAAVAEGVNKERDRVSAHLILGEKSGAMETAVSAVKDGSEMTATLQATYLAAGMNHKDGQNRADDEKGAQSALDNADKNKPEGDDDGQKVFSAVLAGLGASIK